MCVAHIDVSCVRRNLRVLTARSGVAPDRIMPVIKADAYRHGLIPVAHALAQEGVTHFAVNTVDEGRQLREAGFTQDIVLLLGAAHQDALALAARLDCIPLIHSDSGLARFLALPATARPRIAIKCDTGMTRLGFSADAMPAVCDALRNAKTPPVLAVSHLASADMPEAEGHTRAQAAIFATMAVALREVFPHIQTSLCNSAGMLAYPEYVGDMARPGECLYGGNVFDGTIWQDKGAGFAQAMSFSAPVLQVRDVPAGQSVSYGGIYTPVRDVRLAVLGMGYADGYPRSLSNRGEVYIAGQVAPVRGRVCMCMTLVDISHIQGVKEGDRAWITGGPYENAVSMDELARQWGSIAYEVHCVLGRNTREYV